MPLNSCSSKAKVSNLHDLSSLLLSVFHNQVWTSSFWEATKGNRTSLLSSLLLGKKTVWLVLSSGSQLPSSTLSPPISVTGVLPLSAISLCSRCAVVYQEHSRPEMNPGESKLVLITWNHFGIMTIFHFHQFFPDETLLRITREHCYLDGPANIVVAVTLLFCSGSDWRVISLAPLFFCCCIWGTSSCCCRFQNFCPGFLKS